MYRLLILTFVIFFIPINQLLFADGGKNTPPLNVTSSNLAIEGYDPVSYHNQDPQKGVPEHSHSYQGATYQFASDENLNTFKQNPEKFIPAYGGWCAWAMIDGEKVEVDPKTYKIIDNRTYLFYNSFFINTLSKWNKRAENETEAVLLQQADSHWDQIAQSP